MGQLPEQFYAQWRAQGHPPLSLREGIPIPPEKLAQKIWLHQRLKRDELKSLNGEPIRVLHPGFWNHEAGPDFKGAVIQFGNAAPQVGDVEIDSRLGDWRGHQHAGNPNYRGVILRVIWPRATKPLEIPSIPILSLEGSLDAPLEELHTLLGPEALRTVLEPGRCGSPLAQLPAETRRELLQQAGQIRLQRKASDLEGIARRLGWEQALWQGLFTALGYKQNSWPMRSLAETLPSLTSKQGATDGTTMQARLFGLAGFLTEPKAGQNQTRRLWDHWWRDRAALQPLVLPHEAWKFRGLRPANHPQRRLALASHWLANAGLFKRLESWFTQTGATEELAGQLAKLLDPGADAFWNRHATLHSKPLAAPVKMLGETRATDLAINVILPWFWVRARAGGNRKLQTRAEQLYREWPMAEDNAVLKLARQRLFGSTSASATKTAAEQQGLLQIVRDFCEHSNALCDHCRFPDLVRAIRPR